MCATELTLPGSEVYAACGNVSVSFGGKTSIGYIIDEQDRKRNVILQNNKVIEIDVLKAFVSVKGSDKRLIKYK